MASVIAFDPGYGNVKLHGSRGGLSLVSAVSVAGEATVRRMRGLRCSHPPLRIETDLGRFYVGSRSHDWGRPVENLDFDRLAGYPRRCWLCSLGLSVATAFRMSR